MEQTQVHVFAVNSRISLFFPSPYFLAHLAPGGTEKLVTQDGPLRGVVALTYLPTTNSNPIIRDSFLWV